MRAEKKKIPESSGIGSLFPCKLGPNLYKLRVGGESESPERVSENRVFFREFLSPSFSLFYIIVSMLVIERIFCILKNP